MKKFKHKQTGWLANETANQQYHVVEVNWMIPIELIEKSNDWELIHPTIEVGKIYKKEGTKILILIKELRNNSVFCIGFNYKNDWVTSYSLKENVIEATKEEWSERLKEEAIKRGLVKGVKFESAYLGIKFTLNDYKITDCFSLAEIDRGHLMDSDTGKWATVIEDKKPILTTHNGVDFFDRTTKAYAIKKNDLSYYFTDFAGKFNDYERNNCLFFSTKEKALEYIELNKPKYSLNDIDKAFGNSLCKDSYSLINELKKLNK